MFQTRGTQSDPRVARPQIVFYHEMSQLEILAGRGAVSRWASLSHGVNYAMSDFHKHDTVAVPGNTGVLFQFKVADYDDGVERFFNPYRAACAARKLSKPLPTDRPMAFYEAKGVCRVFVVIQCAKNGYADPAPRKTMDLVTHYKSLIPTYIFRDKDADAAAMCIFNTWLAGESPFSAKMPTGSTSSDVPVPAVAPPAKEKRDRAPPAPVQKKRERALPPPPPPPSSPAAENLSIRIESPAPLPADEFAALDRLFTDPAMGFVRPLAIEGDAAHVRYVVTMQFPNAEMRDWILDALSVDRLEVAREVVKSFVSSVGHRDTTSGEGIAFVIDTCCPVGDVVELTIVTGDIRCPAGVVVGRNTSVKSSAPTLAVTVANVRTQEELDSIRARWNECVARADVHEPIRQLIKNRVRGERLTAEETVALRKFGEEVEMEKLASLVDRAGKVQDEKQLLRIDTYFKWADVKSEKSPDDEQLVEFTLEGMRKKQCVGLERLLDSIEAASK